ncbi:hypothetical protein Mapa_011262 [Marchantia paleacea]|nr:hypothetical protein Mapa_011262 [Marchantia paleacea]
MSRSSTYRDSRFGKVPDQFGRRKTKNSRSLCSLQSSLGMPLEPLKPGPKVVGTRVSQ